MAAPLCFCDTLYFPALPDSSRFSQQSHGAAVQGELQLGRGEDGPGLHPVHRGLPAHCPPMAPPLDGDTRAYAEDPADQDIRGNMGQAEGPGHHRQQPEGVKVPR